MRTICCIFPLPEVWLLFIQMIGSEHQLLHVDIFHWVAFFLWGDVWGRTIFHFHTFQEIEILLDLSSEEIMTTPSSFSRSFWENYYIKIELCFCLSPKNLYYERESFKFFDVVCVLIKW